MRPDGDARWHKAVFWGSKEINVEEQTSRGAARDTGCLNELS
jgi:hypothetical protein